MSYISQYSGYNFKLFKNLPDYNRTTIGRLLEMIPFPITGFTLGYYNIIYLLEKYKIKTLILSFVIYLII